MWKQSVAVYFLFLLFAQIFICRIVLSSRRSIKMSNISRTLSRNVISERFVLSFASVHCIALYVDFSFILALFGHEKNCENEFEHSFCVGLDTTTVEPELTQASRWMRNERNKWVKMRRRNIDFVVDLQQLQWPPSALTNSMVWTRIFCFDVHFDVPPNDFLVLTSIFFYCLSNVDSSLNFVSWNT